MASLFAILNLLGKAHLLHGMRELRKLAGIMPMITFHHILAI